MNPLTSSERWGSGITAGLLDKLFSPALHPVHETHKTTALPQPPRAEMSSVHHKILLCDDCITGIVRSQAYSLDSHNKYSLNVVIKLQLCGMLYFCRYGSQREITQITMLLQFPVQEHQEGSGALRQEEQHLPELCVTLLSLHHIIDQPVLYSLFHSSKRSVNELKMSLNCRVERKVHSEGTKLFSDFSFGSLQRIKIANEINFFKQ